MPRSIVPGNVSAASGIAEERPSENRVNAFWINPDFSPSGPLRD